MIFYFFLLLFSFILTVIIEKKLIPLLKSCAKQPIYTEGPSWHISKQGTPTMGGIAFLIAILLCSIIGAIYLFFTHHSEYAVITILISLIYALTNGLIGVFDDLMKLSRQKNAGLSPFQKLSLQFILALIFLLARKRFFDDPTSINIGNATLNLGVIYYPFAIVLLLGIVNCANLTDGIDGLATSVALTIGIVFAFLSRNSIGALIVSICLIGGCLGFLVFNKHPAKIFMGDTGSLFLGAICASLAFALQNPMVIILIGGVYVIEGLSVILQVVCYKLFEKRIFKMAPIHHHLEKIGFKENSICKIAIITTIVLSLIAILVF